MIRRVPDKVRAGEPIKADDYNLIIDGLRYLLSGEAATSDYGNDDTVSLNAFHPQIEWAGEEEPDKLRVVFEQAYVHCVISNKKFPVFRCEQEFEKVVGGGDSFDLLLYIDPSTNACKGVKFVSVLDEDAADPCVSSGSGGSSIGGGGSDSPPSNTNSLSSTIESSSKKFFENSVIEEFVKNVKEFTTLK